MGSVQSWLYEGGEEEEEEMVFSQPLSLEISIEKVQVKDDPATFSKQQQMHMRGSITQQLPDSLKENLCKKRQRKSHLILAVDQSGSMAGSPFNQVKVTLQEIVGHCISDENKVLDVVVYASEAKTITLSMANYSSEIDNLHAGGGTVFKAAFQEIERVMKNRKKVSLEETTIVFMTDGCDGSSRYDLDFAFEHWKQFLNQQSSPVTVHVVGFSKDHDLKLLNKISNAGSNDGLYRYCEPGDGPEALKNKLEELFEHIITRNGIPVKFYIKFNDTQNKLLLQNPDDGSEGCVDGTITLTDTEDGNKDATVSSDCWLMVEDPSNMPSMCIEMHLKLKRVIKIPCSFGDIEEITITDASRKAIWDMAILLRNVDALTVEFSDALAKEKDVTDLKEKLDSLQNRLSNTAVFNRNYNKEARHQILENIKIIQAKVDKLHSILAHYLRGECKGVSLLAKAQDLRYDAQFTKSRRQRLMHRRVAQNFQDAKANSEQATVASMEEVASLSQDTLDFYTCILSMYDVKDLLLDDSDLDNALGIGLSVSRPEHALDNPTSIRVINISGSIVSRSFLMDALKLKIDTAGPLAAHGGFSFESIWQSDVAYATVDASRQPINAWLPLYITRAHWDRVKAIFKSTLGYFCTLDPLGFAASQFDVPFMILGDMIGQLTSAELGENQLKLIFAMQRTCSACMEEFGLKEKILNQVIAFLDSPLGRFRNEIPNLKTLIGYIAALPSSDTKSLMDKSFGGKAQGNKLWIALITEVLRRASSSVEAFHETGNTSQSLLNLLLYGSKDKGEQKMAGSCKEAVCHFGQLSWDLASAGQQMTDLVIPDYDPCNGVTVPDVHVKQTDKINKAMEILAQAHCGYINKKNHAAKIGEAKKLAKKWFTRLYEEVGLPLPTNSIDKIPDNDGNQAEASEPGTSSSVAKQADGSKNAADLNLKQEAEQKALQFDSVSVTPSILDAASKVLAKLSKHCFPPLSSLPGCAGFLHYWAHSGNQVEDLDKNGGIPPEHWISETKKNVIWFYRAMEDSKRKSKKSPDLENEGLEGAVGGAGNNDQDGRPQNDANEEWDEDDYGSGYESDFEREDDVTQNLRDKIRRSRQTVTVPMLLSALGVHTDQLQLVRAMLCQAISYPSNSQARDATEQGRLADLSQRENAHGYVSSIVANLILHKDVVRQKMKEKAIWKVCNSFMLNSGSIWTFIGYLMCTHKERDEGFSELIDAILKSSGAEEIPLLLEKMKILLTGKHDGNVVFANGNSWMPKKNLLNNFETLLGDEMWMDLERELMSNVQIHVYRESDLPNRHGHCNSNPYIPNSVRKVLGMALIDEKIQPRTSKKRHRSLR